ncbi:hypothetical protein GIB67_009752 [Kingdonia uniflora]|uniref:Aminotransferase-like plant mobile domain-containing protein n=1 Tax=Kingdonia uniflora TaxID=39325 RepID=A0A7J7LBA0_9MAGN|nr:hypothetical protein GIB67_009752 [Kingdonia uniflora]
MLDLTMSSEEEEYTESSDEEEEYDECKVSQLHFLSGKKWKVEFEEVLNGHLSTSVATTLDRVGFKCRSILAKLRKIYLRLIKVPHLNQKLKATNLMSVFDRKIRNGDNQVVLAMVERWWPSTHTFYLPCEELGITPRDFTVLIGIGIGIGEPIIFEDFYTEYDKALAIFPAMEFKDYEKGCISFAHLETYLDHTRVDFNDKGNTKVIFRAFMLLYFGGVLFGNSKSWARLELIGPLAILKNKTYTINFGFAILRHLYYCLDQASKQEYHCYEYYQIGHHILIDNRLDNFYPRMLAWQTTRRKFTGNKEKHHLALMRQQLDLRTINSIQWDPFRNMKDTLKREVVIAGNISRKRVLLQCPFGGYKWYLGDRCWAQLEHRDVPYDPPEKLHCFPTDNLVTSLREAGWIEAQHYIVGYHVDYDAYWRHVSHGTLMLDIARCGNIGIPGPGALTDGVTFPHVEFPTADFFTQETQIPPPQFGNYLGWTMELGSPHGTTRHTIPSSTTTSTIDVPTGYDFFAITKSIRKLTLDMTLDLQAQHLHDESRITHLTANLRRAEGRLSQLNEYLDGQVSCLKESFDIFSV